VATAAAATAAADGGRREQAVVVVWFALAGGGRVFADGKRGVDPSRVREQGVQSHASCA